MNGSSINYGFINNVQNLYVKGSRLTCSDDRIQAKAVDTYVTWTSIICLQTPIVAEKAEKKYFSVSLNVHGVNDARQTEIHRAEQQVPEPSALRLWRLSKSWKDIQGIDQIPAKFFQGRSRIICFEIYMLIRSTRDFNRNNCLNIGTSQSGWLFIR